MTAEHKKKRLTFAREHLEWGAVNWGKVIFTDEKKFNVDGPDGLASYWHDLRLTPEYFSKRQQGGNSVMVWGAISYFGTVQLSGVPGNMDSRKYCKILCYDLLPPAAELLGEDWVLMHDGVSVHRSNFTRKWLEQHNISCLGWPGKSPDLNVIENVWGKLVREVYKHGKQFESVEELAEAIFVGWELIEDDYCRKLYKSIPRRLVEVLERKGRVTNY